MLNGGNGNGAGNYVVTGAYNLQTNSLTFAGNNGMATKVNNGGGLVVSNASGNYDSLRSYNGYHTSNSNRSPRMLSTFSNNVGQNNNSYITDINLHNQQQHLISNSSDIIEGDIV